MMRKIPLALFSLGILMAVGSQAGEKAMVAGVLAERISLESQMAVPGQFSSDEAAVIETVQAFKKSYESLDASSLLRIWPSLSDESLVKIREAFSGYKEQSVHFYDAEVIIEDSDAVFVGVIQLDVKTKLGKEKHLVLGVSIKLKKDGSRWLLDSFYAASNLLEEMSQLDVLLLNEKA